MRKFAFFAALLFMFACTGSSSYNDKKIEDAVTKQLNDYPLSSLQDIYKNFFQDRFGPGHIISSSDAANNYLQSELDSTVEFKGPYYEPTGADGHFYRVNLSVIRNGMVPYDVYFSAFVRSVNGIKFPTIEQWQKEWQHIESIISKLPQCPDGFEEDKTAIAQLLAGGEYVMHHSSEYSQVYDPHYRIIERSIFEQEILPLIERGRK